MPMYSISRASFDAAFRTFVSVFPNASFWYVRGHGLFIATKSPFTIDYPALRERWTAPAVRGDMASVDINTPDDMLALMLMGPRQIQAYLASGNERQVNTDDNAYLEYHTPFEFLDTTGAIVQELVKFAAFDADLIQGASDADKRRIEELWVARRDRILPELSEPIR
jgi:hypothetical protein